MTATSPWGLNYQSHQITAGLHCPPPHALPQLLFPCWPTQATTRLSPFALLCYGQAMPLLDRECTALPLSRAQASVPRRATHTPSWPSLSWPASCAAELGPTYPWVTTEGPPLASSACPIQPVFLSHRHPRHVISLALSLSLSLSLSLLIAYWPPHHRVLLRAVAPPC